MPILAEEGGGSVGGSRRGKAAPWPRKTVFAGQQLAFIDTSSRQYEDEATVSEASPFLKDERTAAGLLLFPFAPILFWPSGSSKVPSTEKESASFLLPLFLPPFFLEGEERRGRIFERKEKGERAANIGTLLSERRREGRREGKGEGKYIYISFFLFLYSSYL